MSSFADREIIASGFTLAVAAIVIGGLVQFTHHGALNHALGYALVACGVVLVFVCYVARASRDTALIRTLLTALAGVLLVGMLLKDAIEKLI